MGIFKRQTSRPENTEEVDDSVLNLNRPFGIVREGAWKNLSEEETMKRYLYVAAAIKNSPQYDDLVRETAKNWFERKYFSGRHWGKWVFALLVDGMLLSEVLRSAQAGLLESEYDEEALNLMTQLYFSRLQNLDAAREMWVVDMYYRVLQNTPDLDVLRKNWEKFSDY